MIDEENFLKLRENNLLLSDSDIQILKKYGLNYMKYHNLSELVFAIENILNENAYTDLEDLSIKLGEYNYYNYTNK